MIDNAVLAHVYDVTPEALWNAVKVVLKITEGVTLEAADDEQMRAYFKTSMSWTSWGENMIATVEPRVTTGALLLITGHPHTNFLTTQWGEEAHQEEFSRKLTKAVRQALN